MALLDRTLVRLAWALGANAFPNISGNIQINQLLFLNMLSKSEYSSDLFSHLLLMTAVFPKEIMKNGTSSPRIEISAMALHDHSAGIL